MDENEEEEEEEEEEEDEGGFGSDDDDKSWKVRKAAVRVVAAVIAARPEIVNQILDSCALELVSRFKEREENVRLDVLACFSSLLHAATSSTAARSGSKGKLQHQVQLQPVSVSAVALSRASSDSGLLIPESGTLLFLIFYFLHLFEVFYSCVLFPVPFSSSSCVQYCCFSSLLLIVPIVVIVPIVPAYISSFRQSS
jgi:hypothetical protein